jgi:hypothetical protein
MPHGERRARSIRPRFIRHRHEIAGSVPVGLVFERDVERGRRPSMYIRVQSAKRRLRSVSSPKSTRICSVPATTAADDSDAISRVPK